MKDIINMRIKLLVDSIYIILYGFTTAVGFLFHITGFSSQYWFKGPLKTHEYEGFTFTAHTGLWRGCDESDTFCFTPTGPGETGKMRVADPQTPLLFNTVNLGLQGYTLVFLFMF